MLMLMIAITLLIAGGKRSEASVPYTPTASQTSIQWSRGVGNTYIVTVTYTFYTSGYTVNWGYPVRSGNSFILNNQVYAPTGYVLQVISTQTRSFNLGTLPSGYIYTFDVYAWNTFEGRIRFPFMIGTLSTDNSFFYNRLEDIAYQPNYRKS